MVVESLAHEETIKQSSRQKKVVGDAGAMVSDELGKESVDGDHDVFVQLHCTTRTKTITTQRLVTLSLFLFLSLCVSVLFFSQRANEYTEQ